MIKSGARNSSGIPLPYRNCEQTLNGTAGIHPLAGLAKKVRRHLSARANNLLPKQSAVSRMFWFLMGGGVKYVLILMPFRFLETHTALPLIAISAASMAVSTTFFFFWNYFVNFRTDSGKRDSFIRYLVAVTGMWALSTLTLTFLKSLHLHYGLQILSFPIDLDIVTTQVCLAGFKFLVYHKWVFPVESRRAYESSRKLTEVVE